MPKPRESISSADRVLPLPAPMRARSLRPRARPLWTPSFRSGPEETLRRLVVRGQPSTLPIGGGISSAVAFPLADRNGVTSIRTETAGEAGHA